jgi:NADPH2:quinone reductase
MRAVICEALGGLDGLVVRDVPEPAAGPGEVLLEMSAAALNFPDVLTIAGTYQHKRTPPFVPGMEGAGRIAAVGAGVDAAHLGRRVVVSAHGTFAERMVVPLSAVTACAHHFTDAEAAAFPVIAKTAYHALRHRAAVRPGETVLVNGASGGTGHMAVKMAKAFGARVIATGGDAAKLALVAGLGADAVLTTGGDDLADRIKAANGGRGVDVVFDPVGGAVLDAALKATAFGARVCVVGFTAGAPNVVRTNYALIKSLSILGVRAGEAARHDPALARDYDLELPRLAAAHDLRPRIAATYPLDAAAAALARLSARDFVGKIVLDLGAG